jgi:thymidylate synthase (FAD)
MEMNAAYIDHMGSDLTVVNAARVSFAKESEWDLKEIGGVRGHPDVYGLSDRDEKLIRYLATHHHWTPFAHPQITLHIKAPIFIRTQCFKHKVGFTENEVSRRYVDEVPTFYVPDAWRKRADNKKQGSSDEVVMTEAVAGFTDFCTMAVDYYNDLLDSGVAPEQARMVLPQAMYTEWYWTGSLAAYARFVKQRTDPHAQYEIQVLARQVGEIIEPLFPVSWAALTAD